MRILPSDLDSRDLPADPHSSFFFSRPSGKMLEHIKAFLPDPSTSSSAPSYLFFVLPTPCVVNSRYTSEDHWRGLMLAVGFEQVKERLNKKGKGVAYWLYKRVEPKGEKPVFGKKTILDPSAGRNNFAVVL